MTRPLLPQTDGYKVSHHREYDEAGLALANVLMRMGGDHWTALEYVQITGSQPLMVDVGAVEDLLEWGAVTRSPGWKMKLTDLGTTILEEGTP